jgi:hypothetical protein
MEDRASAISSAAQEVNFIVEAIDKEPFLITQ